jgi:hypothetical protein
MLSESATRLDGLLRFTRATALCADCVGSSLGVKMWDGMKIIRELILDGEVTCTVNDCTECGGHTLVARIRRSRWR